MWQGAVIAMNLCWQVWVGQVNVNNMKIPASGM
jgi:hypothetical protein